MDRTQRNIDIMTNGVEAEANILQNFEGLR